MAPASGTDEHVTLRQWIAVSGAIIGSFCAVLNHQITNTSLREIQAALSASLTEASWITTAYLAAAIVIMPLTAWLTRVFSVRTYATANTAGFMLSLVACALAWDLNAMIALRFAAGPLEAAVTNRVFGFAPPPDKEAMVGYGTFAAVMDTLETAVAGDGYVAGETFSAADVYVGSHVGWGLQLDLIEKRPAFEAYWARLGAREAYLRAVALDEAAEAARS